MIQYIVAAGVGALLGSQGKKSRKKYAQGGEVTTDEALAKAEYLEDYGVDAEQLEDQYLGEWGSPEDFVESWIEDTGGMEGLINPERFYEIDKIGFRDWAMGMAEAMSDDIDEDNVEEYAERHNLEDEYRVAEEKEERYPNNGHMDRFVEKVREEEYDAIVYSLQAENRTAEEVIANIGSDYGMRLGDLESNYLIQPDYTAIADAFEDDGYVYIKKGGKTFVFNYNMKRGGRTKKCMSCGGTTHAKGGKTPVLDTDEVLEHFVMAMLFAGSDEEGVPLDDNYDFDDVDTSSLMKVRELIEKFLHENAEIIEKHNLSAGEVGHDLWLSPTGSGVGFWDRHTEHPTLTREEGDALHESSEKIMGTDMYAIAYDGGVDIDGLPFQYAKGGTTDKSLERALSRFRAIREASELRDAQARERRMIRQHQSGMSAGAFAKGGKTGRETITYNVYNVNGNVIRSAESIADFDEGTITLPNGKKFKVKPDLDFTMKFQKTQIKAKDGLEGLVRNIKEFSSPDSAFNLLYAEKFAPKEMKKGGTTKKPRKQVSDFDKLAMKVAAGYRAKGKSNKEAMEIGRGTAANVYRAQQAKKRKK